MRTCMFAPRHLRANRFLPLHFLVKDIFVMQLLYEGSRVRSIIFVDPLVSPLHRHVEYFNQKSIPLLFGILVTTSWHEGWNIHFLQILEKWALVWRGCVKQHHIYCFDIRNVLQLISLTVFLRLDYRFLICWAFLTKPLVIFDSIKLAKR